MSVRKLCPSLVIVTSSYSMSSVEKKRLTKKGFELEEFYHSRIPKVRWRSESQKRDSLNLCRDTKALNDAITRWEVKLLTNYQNHWASLHLPANLWTSKHKIHCCNKLSLFHIVQVCISFDTWRGGKAKILQSHNDWNFWWL